MRRRRAKVIRMDAVADQEEIELVKIYSLSLKMKVDEKKKETIKVHV